jgi:hypothetical protein
VRSEVMRFSWYREGVRRSGSSRSTPISSETQEARGRKACGEPYGADCSAHTPADLRDPGEEHALRGVQMRHEEDDRRGRSGETARGGYIE